MLCKVMGVNRSGYYKWRKRQGTENRYIQDRRLLTELILERHQKHKVWGYGTCLDEVALSRKSNDANERGS